MASNSSAAPVKPLKKTNSRTLKATAKIANASTEFDDPIESRPVTRLRKTGLSRI